MKKSVKNRESDERRKENKKKQDENRGQNALKPHLHQPYQKVPELGAWCLRGDSQIPLLCIRVIFLRREGKFFLNLGPSLSWSKFERTAVAAIQLRMRMQILTRPENSLANFCHQISKKRLQIKRCEGIR